MTGLQPLRKLLKRIHNDERGAVTLETVLIVGAVAIPILIFIINYVMPKIQEQFDDNIGDLDVDADNFSNQQVP
ncbi:MAG: hypothetical protein P8M30_01770 [Planctomycetaceae bacterium]|jgi:Flp pilus assembly pilin Flp|nr:hypothetical protein [bacterium]MDC0307783.1 hypothetical protein [Planctomycetaceae bacterium]MDG2388023.1 hypothetical protein [Planctomycetaceae bacterium]